MARVKVARTPVDDAHLATKRATLRAQRASQLYLLADEDQLRAIAAGRRAPAEIRRQARAALRWFPEVKP